MKNKIGWCSMTWNPVWGCNNHCEYCYARKINKRFWAKMLENERDYHFRKHQSWAWTGDQLRDLHDFVPTFLEAQFNKKFPKKPQRIFVGSMSEIAHWEKRWMEVTLGRILYYPQHTFQFLTRYPEVYYRYKFPKNCWLGVTITKKEDFIKNDDNWEYFFNEGKEIHFFSFEPLLEPVDIDYLNCSNIDWVIIGAETGTRKGKVIPKREWIDDIISYCMRNDIPFYIKDNLELIHPCNVKLFPKKGCL